jgi:hypothetical protein
VSATIHRVNSVFMLTDDFRPGPGLLKWTGTLSVGADATVEIPK